MSINLQTYSDANGHWHVGELPEGADALVFAQAARRRGGLSVFVARDESRAMQFRQFLMGIAPDIEILDFPAWDCLPYDRISPSRENRAKRAATLARLIQRRAGRTMALVTTIGALMQRLPPRDVIRSASLHFSIGASVNRQDLEQYFVTNGYSHATTVIEPGDFAFRGGIVDVYPPGFANPVRMDFFGDEIESIKTFDPDTQRSIIDIEDLTLMAVDEVTLTPDTIARFRKNFVAQFGGGLSDNPLYTAVRESIRYQGVEHWLPLFYEKTETVFDYANDAVIWAFDSLCDEARAERETLIKDYYDARKIQDTHHTDAQYHPLDPEQLYVFGNEFSNLLKNRDCRFHSPFTIDGQRAMNMHGRAAKQFSTERRTEGVNVFQKTAEYINSLLDNKDRIILATWSAGSSERMGAVLADHGLVIGSVDDWADFQTLKAPTIKRMVIPLVQGFSLNGITFISEQDILGDRLVSKSRKRKGKNYIAEIAALHSGDLVIHIDHGLGRYRGLKTLDIQDAPHDCVEIEYAGGGTLYLPVENLELLSRYGEGNADVPLDRLGGVAWQSRKAKAKKRLKDMAGELIKIAAARALKTCEAVDIPQGAYEEFAARFPYTETQDQLSAIQDTIADLTSGKPMDRLVCGDVGFGKTEIALRAAFLMAMSGRQVAVVTPTTILARQHFTTFVERFRGLPVQIRQLSRLVSAKQAQSTREELQNGRCDIVVGTHALLAKTIKFKDLGLLIVDEEQRFGVRHKEKLKSLRANVHVLTLSATPIPRTLQMALTGIRDLSLITTPPVDRLAVKTFITPFDTVTLREVLLREKYRGGQCFFVVPRISDLRRVEGFINDHVPEMNYIIAHGQMAPKALEDVMTAFYDRKYDILLSTSIIESGIDIPTANTIVVYRADRFGLAQLYQMRGRVGRSKVRAFAYLTTPEQTMMTKGAEQRLKILQSLDTLGAGFSLASHDLDMRGGGNPLGEEQSGQMKDLGVELYQHMLEEAVAELKSDDSYKDQSWSPQVNIGIPVLIPESYVKDLNVRLSLYRRMTDIENPDQEHEFAAEMVDRFGPLPMSVKNLIKVLEIKRLAKQASVNKIDVGPKGVVFGFRHESLEDPTHIFAQIAKHLHWRLRPDQTLFVATKTTNDEQRINLLRQTLKALLID